jgi:phosphonate transport system ATP-binding protein
MKKPLLSVRNLNKIYPSGVQALKNVTFDVEAGEFLVIIGLSGSGKSTLLRCMNRLETPSSGTIEFEGRHIEGLQGKAVYPIRKQIGMIFQNFNLIPRHSSLLNVLMGRLSVTSTFKSLLGWFSKADRERAMRELGVVGIADKAFVRADQLSGGQQQRVAIARALSQDPKVLLADEPVASLDPTTSHTVMDALRKVNRDMGLTVVCSLHYLDLVREYATRVIALKDGSIVFEGSPKEITDQWFKKIYG